MVPLPVLLNVIILGSSKNESKIGRAAAKSGTFSERHRKATRTLAHLNFARKTRTVASVCLGGFFPFEGLRVLGKFFRKKLQRHMTAGVQGF